MTDSIAYAYAVARDADLLAEAVSGVPGVTGAPVRLVRAGQGADLVAAVSPVPERDFAEQPLKRHLEDLDWLESVARAHHGVVEALAARTTVLPLRLATVYLDDDRVRAVLETHREAFSDRLSRLAAHIEWGVKLFVEPPARDRAARPPEPADSQPGRAYLRLRGAQRRSREDAYRAAERAARLVETAAAAHAVDRVRHRVQQGQLAGGPGDNVVNDAYLVPSEHAEEFRAEVLRAAEGAPGIRVEVTGPWVPYSFAAPPAPEPEPPRERAS